MSRSLATDPPVTSGCGLPVRRRSPAPASRTHQTESTADNQQPQRVAGSRHRALHRVQAGVDSCRHHGLLALDLDITQLVLEVLGLLTGDLGLLAARLLERVVVVGDEGLVGTD